MEGPALPLILVLVLWGGLECNVKQVGDRKILLDEQFKTVDKLHKVFRGGG